jgi:hypothetical protein
MFEFTYWGDEIEEGKGKEVKPFEPYTYTKSNGEVAHVELCDIFEDKIKIIVHHDDDHSSIRTCHYDNRDTFQLVDQYFEDREICEALYSKINKQKDFFAPKTNDIIRICRRAIELYPIIIGYFEIEFPNDQQRVRVPAFDTLRVLYTKRKEFHEALEILELEHELGQEKANYESLKNTLMKKIAAQK